MKPKLGKWMLWTESNMHVHESCRCKLVVLWTQQSYMTTWNCWTSAIAGGTSIIKCALSLVTESVVVPTSLYCAEEHMSASHPVARPRLEGRGEEGKGGCGGVEGWDWKGWGTQGHGKWKTANGENEGNGKDGRIDIVKDNDVWRWYLGA